MLTNNFFNKFPYTLLIILALMCPVASAGVMYQINFKGMSNVPPPPNDPPNPELMYSGNLDFVGDLSKNGVFVLNAKDIASLYINFEGTALGEITEAGLMFNPQKSDYMVTNGQLVALDLFLIKGNVQLAVGDTANGGKTNNGWSLTDIFFGTGTVGTYTIFSVPEPSVLSLLMFGLGLFLFREQKRT